MEYVGGDIMTELNLRARRPDNASAMHALFHSVTSEGDTLPFRDEVNLDFIKSQWLDAHGCVVACREGFLLGMYRYGPICLAEGSTLPQPLF